MIETAREAMKPVTWGAPRMGRKAARSTAMPMRAPASSTPTATTGSGAPRDWSSARVTKAPIITMSPWAKLISRTMP